MIRLCTHCKKVDTESETMKYCQKCYVLCLRWLDGKAQVEPPTAKPSTLDTGAGKILMEQDVRRLYNHSSDKKDKK